MTSKTAGLALWRPSNHGGAGLGREAAGELRGFELDGKEIPKGQHCKKFAVRLHPRVEGLRNPGGHDRLPGRIQRCVIPALSSRGGHGIVGFEYAGGDEAVLPSVPGGTEETPAGTWIEKKNRATGAWKSPGYLPPCSGGRGNRYVACQGGRRGQEGAGEGEDQARPLLKAAYVDHLTAFAAAP